MATVRSVPYVAPAPRNLQCLNRADRIANALLLVVACALWAGVAYVFTNLDPRADSNILLGGALVLGAAVGVTIAPLLWLAGFVRNREIAFRGDWTRAARRAGLVALVIVLFVMLRAQGALSVPLATFVVVMAVLVEVTLSLRR